MHCNRVQQTRIAELLQLHLGGLLLLPEEARQLEEAREAEETRKSAEEARKQAEAAAAQGGLGPGRLTAVPD